VIDDVIAEVQLAVAGSVYRDVDQPVTPGRVCFTVSPLATPIRFIGGQGFNTVFTVQFACDTPRIRNEVWKRIVDYGGGRFTVSVDLVSEQSLTNGRTFFLLTTTWEC